MGAHLKKRETTSISKSKQRGVAGSDRPIKGCQSTDTVFSSGTPAQQNSRKGNFCKIFQIGVAPQMDYTVDSSCLCNIQQLTNSQTIVSEPIWEEETSEEEIFKQETTNRQMYSCALGIQDAVETLFQCQPQGFLMGVSMLLGGSWEFKCSQKVKRNCGRRHHHHPSMCTAWPDRARVKVVSMPSTYSH